MKSALKLAHEYEWQTAQEYFDYIVDSFINGQYTQVRNLYNAMNSDSKFEFIYYLVHESGHSDAQKLHTYIKGNC